MFLVCFGCGNTAHVCEHVHTCELRLLGPPHPLSLPYWIARSPSYLPNVQCYITIATAFLLSQHKQPFWVPSKQFPPPGSFKWHCWKPPRGQRTRGNTHYCQPETTQRKANMLVYATRTTTWETQVHSADTEWTCAPLRGAGGTCPFKIYFSQLVGAELSGLAWAELHCAVHVW